MKLFVNIYYNLVGLMLSLVFLISSFFLLFSITKMNVFIEWEILNFQSCSLIMTFFFDLMSMSFIGVVGLISGMILGYSKYYMEGDKSFYRFIVILSMFVGSMWLLVCSPNTISLLLGWDGLGLTSYLLVIYYQSESSNNAGMLTVLSNRLGDVCILVIIGMMVSWGSWNFLLIEGKAGGFISFVLVLAGMTKSAQIPFSAWLPAAMAAPTPVSSLVHSSTLVTAGVYLILRFYSFLSWESVSGFLLIISVSTMFMAGLCANFEMDMKKIIALSTLSQLGLMMMEISLGFPLLAYCHLVTHAVFKSTIFMCAGVIIHMNKGSQDMRGLGGLPLSSPVLGMIFSVTNLSLCGFPFLAGYFSKDALLESSFEYGWSIFILAMIVLGTGFTVSYSLRVLFMSGSMSMKNNSVSGLSDIGYSLLMIMGFMFVPSVVGGMFVMGLMSSSGNIWVLSGFQKYYIILISLTMFFICWVVLGLSWYWLNYSRNSLKGLSSMWFCLMVVKKLSSYLFFLKGKVGFFYLDKGWSELIGPQGGRELGLLGSKGVQTSQNALFVSSYLLSFLCLLGLLFMLF